MPPFWLENTTMDWALEGCAKAWATLRAYRLFNKKEWQAFAGSPGRLQGCARSGSP